MRLLNALLTDKDFLVDSESLPYIVRDIINMNWWNTCGLLKGYVKNRRVLGEASFEQKLAALILKEYYAHRILKTFDKGTLEKELSEYVSGGKKSISQLKIASLNYRRNSSQFFHKGGKPTWLDCTSRARYAFLYVGQNGFVDFDGVVRLDDVSSIIDHTMGESAYPDKDRASGLFAGGVNSVKQEIHSQKKEQRTVIEWVETLNISVLPEREWLFNVIACVKTDPFKINEKRLLKQGALTGNNELLYGFKTMASVDKGASNASHASNASRASDASNASNASNASHASSASNASHASNASRASYASNASNASNASHASNTSNASYASRASMLHWATEQSSIGPIGGLSYPPVFQKNKFAMAGHAKLNVDLVAGCTAWFDPFMGHGESPLLAKRLGKRYVGIELNPDSMNGYLLPYVQKAVGYEGDVQLILGDSSEFRRDLVGQFDLCYTSPPYFQFEEYGFHNKAVFECLNYTEFHERVTKPVFSNVMQYLKPRGVLALQTEKNKRLKEGWKKAILDLGFVLVNDTTTGGEANKYSKMSKRDQTLLIFIKPE